MSAKEVLERVRALEPSIREQAHKIEQQRRVPLDVIEELKAAGCFRLAVPDSYRGEEADLRECLEVFEEASRIDGSTGWVTMIGATTPLVLSVFPRATFDAVYSRGADVIGGGTLAPKGAAVPEGGGYRASGEWPFGSGSDHCEWLVLHCLVVENGSPRIGPSGRPDMRLLLVPRSEVEILDTWHVSGLKGTASNDLRIEKAFVPEERSAELFGASPEVESTLFRVPMLGQLSLAVAACALGIARGALDEVTELVKGKRPAFKPMQRVAEDQLARFELGRADLLLSAARALVYEEARSAWEKTAAGAELTHSERARMRAGGWQATAMAAEVVDLAYGLGGGTSIYETCSLQRRFRDVHAVTQHAAVSRDTVAWLGGFLAGESVPEARL
jgi:alkylation response protein AidB-like acyl-CoA dehydrogenase